MNRSRSAAALIMALLILVGLMLLGLPFLFSQSVSRAGSAAIAARQAAYIYARSALNLGIGAAIYAQESYRNDTGNAGTVAWTDLNTSLSQGIVHATAPETLAFIPETEPGSTQTVNRIRVQPTALTDGTGGSLFNWNLDGQRLRVGLSIEDESGKLDGNALGPYGWSRVLEKAGILDKDLGSAVDMIDDRYLPYNLYPNDFAHPRRCGNLSQGSGQLADAIVLYRMAHGPYTSFADLLLVDPQNIDSGWFNDPRQPRTGRPLYRPGLSPAELDRLRPFVTFHTPGPGRQGLIDFGNRAADDGAPQPWTHMYTDWGDEDADDLIVMAGSTWGVISSHQYTHSTSNLPAVGEGLAFLLPSTLNLNQATTATRSTLDNTLAGAVTSLPILNNTQVPISILPWQDTFAAPTQADPNFRRFHPPVGLVSSGIVHIRADVSVLDAKDRTVAEEHREVVVQALPQTGLEARWRDQEELQTLVDRHTGSHLTTLPQPAFTLTTTPQGKDIHIRIPIATTPAPGNSWYDQVGIRPEKLKNLADYPTNPTWLPNSADAPWQSFKENLTTPFWQDAQITADGLLTPGNTGIALGFTDAVSTATPAVAMRQPLVKWDTQGRHVSFWICATDTLNKSTRLLDLQGTETDRSRLNLTWEPTTSLLLLRLATPAFPNANHYRFQADDPQSPGNENSIGWGVDTGFIAPTAPAPASNEILLGTYLGSRAFTPGRWHHIHVVVGSGGPESLAVVVDGIAGRDLSRTQTATLEVGDHALLPTAILLDKLSYVPPETMATTPGAIVPHATQIKPRITMSGFWAAAGLPMPLTSIFPSQGVLRLGREYLAYDQLAVSGDTGTITGYWRGVRQDTVSDSATTLQAYPTTAEHLKNDLVLPGDFAVDAGASCHLVKGRAVLRDQLGDNTWVMGTGTTINLSTIADGTLIPLTITNSSHWPLTGVARISETGSYFEFSFNGGGNLIVTLPIGTNQGPFNPFTLYHLQVVSLACTTTNPTTTTDWDYNTTNQPILLPIFADPEHIRMCQISDSNMANVEWIGYNSLWISGNTLYFINTNGTFPRGLQRTFIQNWQWSGTQQPVIRPIQNLRNGVRETSTGEWMRPGDQLSYRDGSDQWHRLTVRYVAIDHFQTPGTAALDTVNGYFSILDPPSSESLPDIGKAWCLGTGWSPNAHPDNRSAPNHLPALLPTAREWPVGTTLVLGGPRDTTDPNLATNRMLVDGLATGPMPDHAYAQVAGLVGATEWDDTTETLTFTVTTNALRMHGKKTGLALIDGEVIAYARHDKDADGNNLSPVQYELIGRGLLGSERRDHGTFETERPWSVLFLPIGPVRRMIPHLGTHPLEELAADPPNNWFAITEDPETNSRWHTPSNEPPGMVMVVPGTTPTYHGMSLIRNFCYSRPEPEYNFIYTHENTWCVPAWVKTLWSTPTPPTSAPSGSSLPLMLGWFPRYPSALPEGTLTPSHFRSRVYTWAGFPVRMPRMRVDTSRDVELPLQPIPPIPGSQPVYDVQVRAMVGAINGDATKVGCLKDATNGWSNWNALQPPLTVAHILSSFADHDLDGLELRVTWQYTQPATDLERLVGNMNTTPPSIGPVRIPLKVPVAVLASE